MQVLRWALLALLWPAGITYAQTTNIQPLTIGDTLPPDLILENVANYPASKIHLSDLKGKLIILDFWGKYCSPCIHALHKLDSLQKASNGKVQVITISDFKDKDDLYKTLRRFKKTETLSLPVILGNEQLISYFPYTLVSHLVWIDTNGIIKAITGGEYITGSNMQEMLDGKSVNWPVKKDVLDFDYKKPLLDYAQSIEGRPRSLYYSSLSSYMEGISAPNGTYNDSARGVSVTLFYNISILKLVALALDYSHLAKREQFTLNVCDTTKYVTAASQYRTEWIKDNTSSYYAQLPIGLSAKEIETFLRTDIIRWLNLMGIYAEKEMKYINGMPQSHYVITEKAFGKLKAAD